MRAHAGQVVWLPGFFTGIPHAVIDLDCPMVFHGVPVVWSLCGAPVALADPANPTPSVCQRCTARQRSAGQYAEHLL